MLLIEHIDLLIHQKGLKYSDLADLLGVSRGVISNWVKRKTDPPAKYIVLICEFLGVSLDFLFLNEKKVDNVNELLYKELEENFLLLNKKNKERVLGMLELKIYEQKIESSDKTHIKEEPSSIYDNNSNLSLFEVQEKKSDDIVEIPVLGKTAAGDFIYITDEGVYDLKIEQQDPRADYALEVDGDSMEPLIKNGTYIEVQETNYVDNGTIAIVKYNDQVTCKKFYNDGNGKIRLKSLNPNYQDIFLQLTEYDDENDSFRIIGRVLI